MDGIEIRPEKEGDRKAIRELIVEVFTQAYGSGRAEADLVDQLRDMPMSKRIFPLVAAQEGHVVGFVLFSPVNLARHPDVPVCALGPIGVLRHWQGKGIGSDLIREGLTLCRKACYQAVFVTGSLEYYSRFGFAPIAGTGLRTIFNTEHDMALELEPGVLKRVSGVVDYPKPWHALGG